MKDASRLWIFFTTTTLGMVGLLVLLRVDGVSSKLILAAATGHNQHTGHPLPFRMAAASLEAEKGI
jgi:hypothetical protein